MKHSLKKILNCAGFGFLILFSSCFDTTEEFTIKADGSGEYAVTMDMFQMMKTMMSMGGEDKMKSDPEYNEVKDSVFYFKDVVHEADGLTEEEKELFRDARFNMHMAMKEESMFMKFSFPVKRMADFSSVYAGSQKAVKSMGEKAKEQESLANSKAEPSAVNPNDAGAQRGPRAVPANKPGVVKAPGKADEFMRSSDFFDLEMRDGFFSKQVRAEDFKKYMASDTTLSMMRPMLENTSFSTVVHFPRPVRKVDSKRVVLSEDRKTATLKLTLNEYMEHPEYMNFKAEY
jgi:hypothetical protein